VKSRPDGSGNAKPRLERGRYRFDEVEGEPRARDVDIAERLGFERPRDVRKLIERNAAEIEAFGPMRHRGAMVDIGSGAQREVTEYWLNEEKRYARLAPN
jgi:hypothetical protein